MAHTSTRPMSQTGPGRHIYLNPSLYTLSSAGSVEGGWPLGALGWLVSFTVLTMETTNGQRLRTHRAKLHV